MLGMKTKSHVHYHLQKLRAAGFITWTPRRARTIRVVNAPARENDDLKYDD